MWEESAGMVSGSGLSFSLRGFSAVRSFSFGFSFRELSVLRDFGFGVCLRAKSESIMRLNQGCQWVGSKGKLEVEVIKVEDIKVEAIKGK